MYVNRKATDEVSGIVIRPTAAYLCIVGLGYYCSTDCGRRICLSRGVITQFLNPVFGLAENAFGGIAILGANKLMSRGGQDRRQWRQTK
jgi:hypothetical protein